MDKEKIDQKKLEQNIEEIGNKKELSSKDMEALKKNKFDLKGLKLFNFYRRMKLMTGCRKCEQTVRRSVSQDGFLKTPVEKAKLYCEEKLCIVCMKRTEKIRGDY